MVENKMAENKDSVPLPRSGAKTGAPLPGEIGGSPKQTAHKTTNHPQTKNTRSRTAQNQTHRSTDTPKRQNI